MTHYRVVSLCTAACLASLMLVGCKTEPARAPIEAHDNTICMKDGQCFKMEEVRGAWFAWVDAHRPKETSEEREAREAREALSRAWLRSGTDGTVSDAVTGCWFTGDVIGAGPKMGCEVKTRVDCKPWREAAERSEKAGYHVHFKCPVDGEVISYSVDPTTMAPPPVPKGARSETVTLPLGPH